MMSRLHLEVSMSKQTFNSYLAAASALFGMGIFSVLYPVIVMLFAPRRVFAPHHLYFLIAGLILLVAAGICFRSGRSRPGSQGRLQ